MPTHGQPTPADPADACGPIYLEPSGNTVTGTSQPLRPVAESYKVRPCGCRSRFCPRCCKPLGYRLRDRLCDALRSFDRIYMLTLTVDPLLFTTNGKLDPQAAYKYLTDKRCVARLVDKLHGAGYLASKRYFYVVEWQERTQFPHFHVILDARFIPFPALCQAWNSFRPKSAGPVTGKRPGFGSVQFTTAACNRSRDAQACARYVSKYLTKHPDHGYPQWVLDADYRIRRFSTSRGFWRDAKPPAPPTDSEACDCDEGECCGCRRYGGPRTIRQRVAACGSGSVVLHVREEVDPRTGELVVSRRFVGRLPLPLDAVRLRLGEGGCDDPNSILVCEPEKVRRLLRLCRSPGTNRPALCAADPSSEDAP